jgi:toxin ParE1/3/4
MARNLRQLEWAPKARRDLIDIWHYFADAASTDIADKLLRSIALASVRLSRHPMSGRPRADISSGLRSILAHPYVIVYRVTDTSVEIARVLHERQDVIAAFDEGEP